MIVSRVVSLVAVVVVVGGLFPASRTRRLVGLGLSALGSRLSIRTRLLAVASSPESVDFRAASSWCCVGGSGGGGGGEVLLLCAI